MIVPEMYKRTPSKLATFEEEKLIDLMGSKDLKTITEEPFAIEHTRISPKKIE